MRTTVEFPPALMRAAKARSAELGESLKTLLTRALEAELGDRVAARRARGGRVTLPLFGDPATGPVVRLTTADLERVLADDDAAAAATLARPPRRRRRARR